jgi:DNA-binding TFAR19-related protein (PDSD5 family)
MDNNEQDKLNQELNQANKAKALFQDPLLKESFDKLRELKLWLAYNVVNKVEQNLLEMIDTGKLASKQLEDYRNSINKKKF